VRRREAGGGSRWQALGCCLRMTSSADTTGGLRSLLEVTNGCFEDANCEKPRLSVGQLSGNPTGGFGSGHDRRPAEFTAAERPLTVGHPEAARRHRVDPTRCGPWPSGCTRPNPVARLGVLDSDRAAIQDRSSRPTPRDRCIVRTDKARPGSPAMPACCVFRDRSRAGATAGSSPPRSTSWPGARVGSRPTRLRSPSPPLGRRSGGRSSIARAPQPGVGLRSC